MKRVIPTVSIRSWHNKARTTIELTVFLLPWSPVTATLQAGSQLKGADVNPYVLLQTVTNPTAPRLPGDVTFSSLSWFGIVGRDVTFSASAPSKRAGGIKAVSVYPNISYFSNVSRLADIDYSLLGFDSPPSSLPSPSPPPTPSLPFSPPSSSALVTIRHNQSNANAWPPASLQPSLIGGNGGRGDDDDEISSALLSQASHTPLPHLFTQVLKLWPPAPCYPLMEDRMRMAVQGSVSLWDSLWGWDCWQPSPHWFLC